MLKYHVIKKFLDAFQHISCGRIKIILPNGNIYEFEGQIEGPKADIIIYDDRTILELVKRGDVGFAESYKESWWDSSDLISLFMFALKNEESLEKYIYGNFLNRFASRISYLFNLNTLKGSKRNIHAHYDLGNSFYELWLDPSMTYSSAVFEEASGDLKSAQYRKYDRIIENINPSGKLLEIGCGWGGFAERALLKGDYDIKGITISKEQFFYAKNRLQGRATISDEDYRIQKGKYDQIVSIEMFEAVGEKFWGTYFSKIKELLDQKGRAMIQTITINDYYFEKYRRGSDAIRTFIFPGGMLPSQEKFITSCSKAGLKATDIFSFGTDYALTMKHWLLTFDKKIQQIKEMGFDEQFIRIWRFYLTFCIASFQIGRTNVMQIALEHDK